MPKISYADREKKRNMFTKLSELRDSGVDIEDETLMRTGYPTYYNFALRLSGWDGWNKVMNSFKEHRKRTAFEELPREKEASLELTGNFCGYDKALLPPGGDERKCPKCGQHYKITKA